MSPAPTSTGSPGAPDGMAPTFDDGSTEGNNEPGARLGAAVAVVSAPRWTDRVMSDENPARRTSVAAKATTPRATDLAMEPRSPGDGGGTGSTVGPSPAG